MRGVKSEARIQGSEGWVEAASDEELVVEQDSIDYRPHNVETEKMIGHLDRVEQNLRKVAGKAN